MSLFPRRYSYQETLRALDDLVRQGKVLYIGVSEWTAEQMTEAVRLADQELLDRIVVNQPNDCMLHRNIEKGIIPVSEKHGIGQAVAMVPPIIRFKITTKHIEVMS
ncbi:voltage-gated potassium channel beta subunit [Gracilibacillus boraciitolerans JCM 21714]|uniref:Voltage-gated potassium channel beta subunit n=1 Tax=Gracilibacillus boraciitolerans JCM 21714 TaxID=1298598 RepID=W4VFZ9_9BACI|nr:voltage-gated potassium channel beta subunit [Gracilibacillus boraciitolerans JCM 21714]